VCEEFPCLSPSTALREWQRLPVGLLEDVIEARTYARLKAAYDAATTPRRASALPATPLLDLVKVITFERAQAEIDEGRGARSVTDDEILTVEANAATAYAALDKLLEIAPPRVRAAAFVTATRVRDEAQRRIRRRTGQTAAGIVVRELANGTGYMVVAEGAPGSRDAPRRARRCRCGSNSARRSMRFGPKPFLLVSGQLEAQAHEARITRGARERDR
jgi:hypothetical protein